MSEIYNPYKLLPGDIVTLDEGFANSSNVKIVRMTPQGVFSVVVPAELSNPTHKDSWEVMTDRLSPTKSKQP